MRAVTVHRLDDGNNNVSPVVSMALRNLTNCMTGNSLEGVSVAEIPS